MNRKPAIQRLVYIAVIGALYTALSVALAPISFGPIQCRIAEALTVLPIFNPLTIWGLTLGCAITNLVGVAMGANILGAADILIGTAATLIAAVCTYLLRKPRVGGLPILAAIPPVLFNAVAVGGELYFAFGEVAVDLWIFAGEVALGQIGACMLLGLPLALALEKTGFAHKLRAI